MKSLIIGEVNNNALSSGTLEIISKAIELNLDFSVITIGNSDSAHIGSDDFSNTYLKSNSNKLNLSSCANEIKSIIEEKDVELVLCNSSYIGRDLIAFLSVDFKTSPVSNVTNFEINSNELIAINSINGGESEYKVTINSDIKLLLIRPKSFEQTEINLNDNFETKDHKEENQPESSRIDPLKTFNYITSSLEKESTEEENALFTLGIYCLQHNEANFAQRSFKRLLMREKDNVDLRCFLLLAISQNNEIDKAINTFQGILANNPNHRYSNVNMGILLKRKGLIQKSRVRFFTTFKLLERSQGDYDVNSCLEAADKFFQEKREKKALEIYEPLIPEISSEELLSRIAGLYLASKNWDGAFDICRRVLRKNRKNNEAREGLKSIYTAYLADTENYLKKNDPVNAALAVEKALKIVQSKKLIHKAVSIHRLLENENKVFELEQILKKMERDEIQIKISEKLRLAEDEESNGKFKSSINHYQEAIKIDPQNSTLKKLVDLCSRIKRPDLAEKFTNWFNEYQHSFQEKQKAQAREAFKKSEQTQKESK